MSHGLAFVDRLLVFVIGLALTFLGVWSIGLFFDVPQANQVTDYADQEMWANAAELGWYEGALIGVVAGGIIIGLWLIIANLRRRSVSVVTSGASTEMGDINFNLGTLADAVADTIEETHGVSKVRKRVVIDRGLTTVEFTVDADADCSVPGIQTAIEQSERDLREAIGPSDAATSYRIHIERVPQNHEI
ncbi:alkaline shock response membrane anchor protein AmaP [Corynebacterium sp. P7202]|uniref:Alkaline shock response membrane anchor protein AmaP n=1 Tax=Corynebacterium pygosceleis TaxID=2800406 RepID=A0A9Q4GLA1_9CORY|nr:alkaline shock response membrane anchor protein AmaP [Corynebacterium pygosceleis]MCK7637501.1 alkaline shock response membrane anchor protein AmaP [Corynebacterium pygosceleis]MCX7444970.1 alkaline shock response membrane anchor protein AmaP [Corynebacterium pygosceleis]MCX7468170.1 alkaline shock response membrane anchor protein AmaP [Corynebacterium pygosceleis]